MIPSFIIQLSNHFNINKIDDKRKTALNNIAVKINKKTNRPTTDRHSYRYVYMYVCIHAFTLR